MKTLDEGTPNTYDTAKAALGAYFKGKKNLTAERYRFFCMKPDGSTETHDHWIMRLKIAGVDCEFDKMDLKEAIKLVVTMHTNSSKLQTEIIIAQDMSYEKMVEKGRAIESTKKQLSIQNKQRIHSKWKHQQLMQLVERVNFTTKEIHNQDPSDQATSLK